MTSATDWLTRAQHENAQLPDDLLADDGRASLRRAIDARLQRRRALRRATWAGSVLALGAALLLNARSNPALPSPARAPAAHAAAATTAAETTTATTVSPTETQGWQFADGSRATALGAATQLRIERDGAVGTWVRLEAGAARFEVQPRADRPFIVRAGAAEVRVIGTSFDVSHRAEGAVEVAVEHGTVQVVTAAGPVLLQAGARRVFTRKHGPAGGGQSVPPASLPTGGPRHTADDEPGELLAAADAARREGRVLDAVAALRRIVSAHGGDPRAPSAAFSLGRVLLEARRNPAEAAAAFATARALDPRGALAEDALAREVEARARAGSSEHARALAELYLQRYPDGARRDFVRAHAGLDRR